MRWVVVLGLAFVGCSPERECNPDDVALELAAGESLQDCGALQTMDVEPLRASRECVREALTNEAAFLVRWTVLRPESASYHALVGRHQDGEYRAALIAGGLNASRTRECAEVRDLGDCDDLYFNLCFECTGGSVGECSE